MKVKMDIEIPDELIDYIVKISTEKIEEMLKSRKIITKNNLNNDNYENAKREIKLLSNETELLTREEMVIKLKISNSTLTKYIKKGILNPIKVGRRYMYTTEDYSYLENILNAKKIFLEKEKEIN